MRTRHYKEIKPITKRIFQLEKDISKLGKRSAEIEVLFTDPEHYKDSLKVIQVSKEYQTIKDNIESLTAEWDDLAAKTEKMNLELQREIDSI